MAWKGSLVNQFPLVITLVSNYKVSKKIYQTDPTTNLRDTNLLKQIFWISKICTLKDTYLVKPKANFYRFHFTVSIYNSLIKRINKKY